MPRRKLRMRRNAPLRSVGGARLCKKPNGTGSVRARKTASLVRGIQGSPKLLEGVGDFTQMWGGVRVYPLPAC